MQDYVRQYLKDVMVGLGAIFSFLIFCCYLSNFYRHMPFVFATESGWGRSGNALLCWGFVVGSLYTLYKFFDLLMDRVFRLRLSTLLMCVIFAGFLMWLNFTPRPVLLGGTEYPEVPLAYGWPWPAQWAPGEFALRELSASVPETLNHGFGWGHVCDALICFAAVLGLGMLIEHVRAQRERKS